MRVGVRVLRLTSAVLASLALVSLAPCSAKAAAFRPLDVPQGIDSVAYGVSPDGRWVVGAGRDLETQVHSAILWDLHGGATLLAPVDPTHTEAAALAVSNGGAVVVGTASDPIVSSLSQHALRWTSSGPSDLGTLATMPFDFGIRIAWGVSGDGSVIVGESSSAGRFVPEAFRWTQSGGMQGLGFLGGGDLSRAYDVSLDGNVIVGESTSAGLGGAVRWVGGGEPEALGLLAGANASAAYGVSSDGSAIVGLSSYGSGWEAFLWTSAGGMIGLGDLPGGRLASVPEDVSDGGAIVVGASEPEAGPYVAFFWSEATGMQPMADVLTDVYGVDLQGWQLLRAYDISSDGSTIVGWGVRPDGGSGAWVAIIPEPATATLLGGGIAAIAARRRRDRR